MTEPMIQYRPGQHAATGYFFGAPWDVPAVRDAVRIKTPAGSPCTACGEPVVEGDRGWLRPHLDPDEDDQTMRPVHAECELRTLVGHRYGICSCTGHQPTRDTARLLWAIAVDGAVPAQLFSRTPAALTRRQDPLAYINALDAALDGPADSDDPQVARWRGLDPGLRILVREALAEMRQP